MYACHGGRNRVGGSPGCLQEVKADLACLEVDVWVADGRDEAHRRRAKRILRRNANVEKPASACVAKLAKIRAQQ